MITRILRFAVTMSLAHYVVALAAGQASCATDGGSSMSGRLSVSINTSTGKGRVQVQGRGAASWLDIPGIMNELAGVLRAKSRPPPAVRGFELRHRKHRNLGR